jgi:hypothetical protein
MAFSSCPPGPLSTDFAYFFNFDSLQTIMPGMNVSFNAMGQTTPSITIDSTTNTIITIGNGGIYTITYHLLLEYPTMTGVPSSTYALILNPLSIAPTQIPGSLYGQAFSSAAPANQDLEQILVGTVITNDLTTSGAQISLQNVSTSTTDLLPSTVPSTGASTVPIVNASILIERLM